jgi:hypothetical protein
VRNVLAEDAGRQPLGPVRDFEQNAVPLEAVEFS